MTNVPKTGPLFKTVDELHASLVDYAQQALRTSLFSREPWHTESVAGDPVDMLVESKLVVVFAAHAKERMAQIAQALWMEREAAEDRPDRPAPLCVDGIPLTSVEEAIYGKVFGAYIPDLLACDPTSGDVASAEAAIHFAKRAIRWFRAAGGGR